MADFPSAGSGLTPEQEATLLHFLYNASTNMLEADRSIMTILSSLLLGDAFRLSAGADQVIITNLLTNIDNFSPGTGIKDQSIVANQDVTGLIPLSTPLLGDDLVFIEANGSEDTSGAVGYEGTNIVPQNVASFGIKFTFEEPISAADFLFYEIFAGFDDTDPLIYQQTRTDLTLSAGDTFDWFFNNPLFGTDGLQIYTRLTIAKGNQDAPRTVLQVRRSSTMPTRHWVESKFRSWEPAELLLNGGLNQIQIIYVSKAGDDLDAGLNVNTPKLTPQAAIVDALLLIPSVDNQIVIKGLDAGDYTGDIDCPEWVHLDFANASLNGSLDISDNCIVSFRRLQKTSTGGSVIKKTTGVGFAKVAVELLIVSDSSQNGLLLNTGVMHIDVGVISVNAGIGIKAKNGSRVSFIISEVQLLNGGTGIGTQVAGGDPNFFSGNILYARDDGTGIFIKSKVAGDIINIQGGSFIADTLFDMGANTTLNAFATEADGGRIADPTATINVTNANSGSRLTVSRGFLTQPLSIHDGLAGTETTLDFGTLNDGIFDLNAGIVEVLVDVRTVQVLTETHITKTMGGSDSEFSAWVETSDDGGSTWSPFPDSLRVEVVSKDGGSVVISELTLNAPIAAGGMFRIRATNTGAAALSVLPPNDLTVSTGTASGFATKVTLRTQL